MIQKFHTWEYIQRIESMVSKRYLNTHVHAIPFTIVKRWKQPKYPSRDEQMNKMWYIHVMNKLFSLKKEGNVISRLHSLPWYIML